MHQYGTLIQTDAKLNLGTSGGALLNLKGEMVGLTVSLAASWATSSRPASPCRSTRHFCGRSNTLKTGSEVEYGFLGVSVAAALRHAGSRQERRDGGRCRSKARRPSGIRFRRKT